MLCLPFPVFSSLFRVHVSVASVLFMRGVSFLVFLVCFVSFPCCVCSVQIMFVISCFVSVFRVLFSVVSVLSRIGLLPRVVFQFASFSCFCCVCPVHALFAIFCFFV